MKAKKEKLTKDVLHKIKNIDDLFYTDIDLSTSWYLERYNEEHYGYLIYDDNNCFGYIVSVPIKKELWDALLNGVMTNDYYINPKMFINESDYNYIVSRNLGTFKPILESLGLPPIGSKSISYFSNIRYNTTLTI